MCVDEGDEKPAKAGTTSSKRHYRPQPDDDEISFALREMKRTHEYWSRQPQEQS